MKDDEVAILQPKKMFKLEESRLFFMVIFMEPIK